MNTSLIPTRSRLLTLFPPKKTGATIIGNIWAMTHDERVYPDPYSFKPERFLDADGKLNNDSRVLAFGFGGRWAL
jgi:cytochrome P450